MVACIQEDIEASSCKEAAAAIDKHLHRRVQLGLQIGLEELPSFGIAGEEQFVDCDIVKEQALNLQGQSVAAFHIEHIITTTPFTCFHWPSPVANTMLPYHTMAADIITSPVVDPSIAAAGSIAMD